MGTKARPEIEISPQIINTVNLKEPAICSLRRCGEEIPEGPAGQFMGKRGEDKYTCEQHISEYAGELLGKKLPVGFIGTVNLKYDSKI